MLEVSQLMTFPYRTDVTVRHRTIKCEPFAVLPVHELEALLVVIQPPVSHLVVGHCVYCQLFSCVTSNHTEV